MRIPGAAASSEEPGAWATSVLESMTLEEKAGQLLMPWMLGDFAPEGSEDYERIAQAVREDGVGGVIVSVGSPSEVAAKINNLQSLARYPLLVAADLESGAGYRMRGAVYLPNNIELGGATLFPSLMAASTSPSRPFWTSTTTRRTPSSPPAPSGRTPPRWPGSARHSCAGFRSTARSRPENTSPATATREWIPMWTCR